MKKKGLIISTIVMVVVLIASLTTATYAWFSSTSVTTISEFNVSVNSNSDVLIGLRNTAAGFKTSSISTTDFSNGAVAYGNGTAGQIGGYWAEGNVGLGTTVEPTNIQWGAQTKAVALNYNADGQGDYTALSTVPADYNHIGTGLATTPASSQINAATINGTALEGVTAAKANNGGDDGNGGLLNGDYVYYLLGAMPAKNLENNELVISLDWTASTWPNLGIVAAIHVAYRTYIGGEASAWQDVDIMGNTYHQNTLKNGVETNITNGNTVGDPQYLTDYVASTGASNADYAYMTKITLSQTANTIDQIELIIYIDGHDSDCISEATGASCKINLWFATTTKQAA